MGLIDDMGSAISGRTGYSKRRKSGHHHHSSHRSKLGSRSPSHHFRSLSRVRSRSQPRSVSDGASIFGGDEKKHRRQHHHSDSDKARRRRSGAYAGIFGSGDSKHNRSSATFFTLGNTSRGSFPGGDVDHRTPSYYKRSPRPNFLHRAWRHIKRLFRDLAYYAKTHPFKVLTLVIVPLVTGGFLTALLARFGLRLPPGLKCMIGLAAKVGGSGTAGLVGEAVRMATKGASERMVHSEFMRGRDEWGGEWARRHEKDLVDGGWVSGLGKTMAKMFL